MKILNYESFLETMQFAVLSNAQRLSKEAEERRKKRKEEEEENKLQTTIENEPNYGSNDDMEVELPEGEGDMELPEGEGDIELPEGEGDI